MQEKQYGHHMLADSHVHSQAHSKDICGEKKAEVFVRGGVRLSEVICHTVRGSRSAAKRVFFAAF